MCCLHAESEVQRQQDKATAQEAEHKRQDEVVDKAKAIQASRSGRQSSAWPEPKRTKSHWDHVMEEMAWMSKEFARCLFCSNSMLACVLLLWHVH